MRVNLNLLYQIKQDRLNSATHFSSFSFFQEIHWISRIQLIYLYKNLSECKKWEIDIKYNPLWPKQSNGCTEIVFPDISIQKRVVFQFPTKISLRVHSLPDVSNGLCNIWEQCSLHVLAPFPELVNEIMWDYHRL